ncbi:MAG TPA: nucleoside hydrolase [Methylomirabilota bacterium]|jgi:purine nucleosidase/pyrimidine-specific ribonucleoside hydrolase
MSQHLLIDTDPGIDDALAILLALASPEARVEVITTVAGNVPVDLATANARRILAVAAPDPMPRLAPGADAPLKGTLVTAAHFHGDDGLGNLDRLVDAEGRPRYAAPPIPLETRPGAEAILDEVDRWGPELTIVALGPLTNLAAALAIDARRLAGAARVVVMGGAIAVPGNVTPAAEFNIYVDPEAAAMVFSSGLPIELIPLDVTRRVVLEEATLVAELRRSATATARFILDFTGHGFTFEAEREGGGMALHDPLAMAVALDPSLVTFERLSVEVECEGRLTRGLTLADRRRRPGGAQPPTCRVALDVDAERALRFVLEGLCRASA